MCSTGAAGCSTQGLGPCLHPPFPLPIPCSASAPSAAPGPACSLGIESERDLSCRECSLPQPSSALTALQPQHCQHRTQQSLCQPWAAPGSPSSSHWGSAVVSSSCWDPQLQSSSSHLDVVLHPAAAGIPSSQRNSCYPYLLNAGCPWDPVPRWSLPPWLSSPAWHLPSQGSPWGIPLGWVTGTAPWGRERTEITPTALSPASQGLQDAQESFGNGK